jgi:hypothetical protein
VQELHLAGAQQHDVTGTDGRTRKVDGMVQIGRRDGVAAVESLNA